MDSVLITGGAGFIGSSLAEKLLELGYKVIVLDNFNDYYDPVIKERNIWEIQEQMKAWGLHKSWLKIFRGDIRDEEALHQVFRENQICTVVHLAAMAGVRPSIAEPGLYFDVNIKGTLNLLEECRENHIRSFVFGSSSSVYGNNNKLPFGEDDPVDNPISPYAASKKAGELLCYTYHYLYKMNIACLRFFTVYGPRQRPDLAIHKFARLISEGKSIPFYGDGTTARDYTYIGDIVDGMVKTIEWLKDNECRYEIFNLGESRAITLNELVSTLEEVLGKKAILCRKPLQPGDVNITYADVAKAGTILGYCPAKELKEGVEDFARWLKTQCL